MIFQFRKNHRAAKQEQPGAVFTKLPDELLLHILHQVDVTEVLRLRETSRFFVDTCTEVIRDKLKILYVHPSPSSIEHAVNICKKSDLSSEVEDICFLSKAPLYRNGQQALLYQRQWASRNPRDDVDRPVRTFEQSYQELLSSLAKLECLQIFSFQESCDRPGFNMLSAQCITNWQDTVANRHRPFTDISKQLRIEHTRYDEDFIHGLATPMAFLFADVDALIAVLNSGINFTRLTLSHELFQDPLPCRICTFGYPTFLRPALSILRPQTLTRLDLTVTAYWESCAWHVHCAELLWSTAATLLELRIGVRHCTRQDHRTNASLRQLLEKYKSWPLEFIDLPRLQRPEFHSPPEWGLCPKQPVSVMKQSLDLERFLEKHCKELRTLHLTAIYPTYGSLVNGVSMKDIQLPYNIPVRETEGMGDHTRAWEILERTEENGYESFDRWVEQQLLAMNTT
jgi:hypothetical protein